MKPDEFRAKIYAEAKKNRPDLDDEVIVAILDAVMVFIKTEDDVQMAIDTINKKPKK